MKRKHQPLFIGLGIITFFALLGGVLILSLKGFSDEYYNNYYRSLSYEKADYSESLDSLNNPFRGYYSMFGYTINDENEDLTSLLKKHLKSLSRDDNNGVLLIEINLYEYFDKPLTDYARDKIYTILNFWSANDYSIVLRFLYDWDGEGEAHDPTSIDIIKQHMEQVAVSINDHSNSLITLQGIFVGSWAEMHGSKYLDIESMTELISKLDEVTSDNVFLAVRTPCQRRRILDSFDTIDLNEAYSGTKASKIGLFDDGLLSSYTDLGTFSDLNPEDMTDVSLKHIREDELDYIDAVCKYAPCGGEICIDYESSNPEVIVDYLSKMHLTYLNLGPATSKLRQYTISDGSIWDGYSMEDYISTHLGYRYRISDVSSEFDSFNDDFITIKVAITNEGFASIYKDDSCKLYLFREGEDEPFLTIPSKESSLKYISGGETGTVYFKVPQYFMYSPVYSMYMSVNLEDNQEIKLANTTEYTTDYGYYVGNLLISRDYSDIPFKDRVKKFVNSIQIFPQN